MSLEPYSEIILELAKQGLSSSEISARISVESGGGRGFSDRNVRKYCADNCVNLRALPEEHLELEVAKAIAETGPTFGRRMMKGYLAVKGVHAAETRIGSVLRTIHRPYNEARRQVGYTNSRCLRPTILANGMWDQVRVDHGKEFYLTLFIQKLLSPHRYTQERRPYLQTPSTRNHTVERIWPEINSRVNYPPKKALLQLVDQELLDMDDSLVKYCVSCLTGQLCQIGVTRVVESWNAHRIPGKGTPNDLAGSGCPKKIPQELLPHSAEAAELYRQQLGSTLTPQSTFGIDPFLTEEDKLMAENQFAEQYSDISELLSRAVNNDFTPYKEALLFLITTTRRNV
ncbi:hypothetical protein D9C73_004069 [Collichthys lucidus]|uniref:Integrase core domain-containing protein n=1 Tax=Collichthys lucidus TaxID=240159 RepID=A0A4V6XYH2_COLLU|nr:hypothetical protein D9C73_004069 [Collichthys lucidus]